MNRILFLLFYFTLFCTTGYCTEYYVSSKGSDTNPDTENAPFKTIGKAAQMAYPGDVITVHGGVYREWINPPRGGESNDKRITYRAASGERVEIKGSEVITDWKKTSEGIWKVTIPNTFFGAYNPYRDEVYGDWFEGYGRVHHTGEVFLNGVSLYEKESLKKVVCPEVEKKSIFPEQSLYVWYAEVTDEMTTIYANFQKSNPNKALTEISARPTCFYPLQEGINYITIQGFEFSQAATQWGAPTAEQVGMIATHWNKGWIIENNIIHDSKCSGITLGKERETGHNVWLQDTTLDGSLHYIEVTFNTLRKGWSKENIGSHIVRNNTIYNCEQTAICGSMGSAFCLIENNHIYNIWTKRQFSGAEIGGIKFHGAIDTQILHNRIHRAGRALWLDWMTQGTRVSKNLFYDNDLEDIFVEVNHGPFLIDNNILASERSLREQSQGGAYVHNLFLGGIYHFTERTRYTPYHLPHSTEVAGLSIIVGGDNRFVNNLFINPLPTKNNLEYNKDYKPGFSMYNETEYPMLIEGNLLCEQAIPYPKIEERGDEVYLLLPTIERGDISTAIVDSQRLGKAKLPRQRYENPDGTAIRFVTDYLDHPRAEQPFPGPLEVKEKMSEGLVRVW